LAGSLDFRLRTARVGRLETLAGGRIDRLDRIAAAFDGLLPDQHFTCQIHLASCSHDGYSNSSARINGDSSTREHTSLQGQGSQNPQARPYLNAKPISVDDFRYRIPKRQKTHKRTRDLIIAI